jgi:putative lipoprotein
MHAEDETAGIVKGTATFRERMALPPDAILEATLEDVSKADAAAEQIAQTRVEHPGNPPIPFEIKYDPARITPNHRYAVRARILVGEQLLFTTDQQYPVLTGGHGHEVQLLLRRASATPQAGGAARPTQPLEGTDWKLTQLGDTSVAAAEPRAPYFVLDSATHRVAGSGGCNRLMGSYEVHDDRLSFGQMAGTMMACSAGMETEQAFLRIFPHVTSWKITGQQLELLDATDKVLARFQARAAK